MNEYCAKEDKQTNLQPKSNKVPDFGLEWPNSHESGHFQELNKDEGSCLGVFGAVEDGERDHHKKFLIIGHDMVVVRSKPMFGRPCFIWLN